MAADDQLNDIVTFAFSRQFITGVLAGSAASYFNAMTGDISFSDHYLMFGSFLTSFGLYMLAWWWYPIWINEKTEDMRRQELVRSVR